MINYRYSMDFTYCHKDGKNKIVNYKYSNTNVKHCIIHSDYNNNNMPIIILDVCISGTVANILVDAANMINDYIIFNINKINIEDEMEIEVPYISGIFNYYTFESINKNSTLDYDQDANPNEVDNLTRSIKIGLIKTDIINANNVSAGGVITATTMQDLVQYCLNKSGMPVLVEQFDYNTSIGQELLPSISTLSKIIEYLNNVHVFYKTNYRFFIDFDTIYLISSSGNAVAKKSESITTVMFDVGDIPDKQTKLEGMLTLNSQKIYYVPITFNDCELADDYITSQQYNSITTIGNTDSNTNSLDILTGSNSIISTKNIRVENDNINMIQNITSGFANSCTSVSIYKVGADNSIFTPNKTYRVKYSNSYDASHNGSYIINSKQEVFNRDGLYFTGSVMISLSKIKS